MATKTLKTSKHKIAPKKVAKKVAPSVILVGTYKDRQLAFIEREGVYNYPIGADDKLKPEDAAQVKELWLYAGRTKTARQVFEATFVGIQTREEFLAAHPIYPKSKSVHARYSTTARALTISSSSPAPPTSRPASPRRSPPRSRPTKLTATTPGSPTTSPKNSPPSRNPS